VAWASQFGGIGFQSGFAICLDRQNNVLVGGISNHPGETFPKYLTLKYAQPAMDSGADIAQSAMVNITLVCSPNPFNPATVASFELRVPSYVNLKVYDTSGRLVTTLVEGWREAGAHEVTFDGSKLASGIYLAKLQAGEQTSIQKLALIK
jgi:hypothetical protein